MQSGTSTPPRRRETSPGCLCSLWLLGRVDFGKQDRRGGAPVGARNAPPAALSPRAAGGFPLGTSPSAERLPGRISPPVSRLTQLAHAERMLPMLAGPGVVRGRPRQVTAFSRLVGACARQRIRNVEKFATSSARRRRLGRVHVVPVHPYPSAWPICSALHGKRRSSGYRDTARGDVEGERRAGAARNSER